jgi:hypothetical protein
MLEKPEIYFPVENAHVIKWEDCKQNDEEQRAKAFK